MWAVGDRARSKSAFWLLPKEPVTKKKTHNNLDCKVSDSVQQFTHNIATPNYPQASLDITTDVFLNWAVQIPCHSRSCQLTAGCSTRCPERLSEQFSSSILAWCEQRKQKKDPVSLFWRLPCWGSAGFPSLPHTWITATTKSADPAAKHSLTLSAETTEKPSPWDSLSAGRWLPHNCRGWTKTSMKTGLAKRYVKYLESRGKALCKITF